MPDYLLRSIDPQTWDAFRLRAESEGHSLKWVFLRLVEGYAESGDALIDAIPSLSGPSEKDSRTGPSAAARR